jgi:hypothetical protein
MKGRENWSELWREHFYNAFHPTFGEFAAVMPHNAREVGDFRGKMLEK